MPYDLHVTVIGSDSYRAPTPSGQTRPTVRRCMKLAARLATIPLLMTATPAWACTLCHSRTAEAVRAAVLGSDFVSNCAALAAPAPVLIMAAYAVRKYLL